MYFIHILLIVVFVGTSILDVHGTQSLPDSDDGIRIVGGQNTTIQKHPYQVYILVKPPGSNSQYQCGGSIVNTRCILTAAHCLIGMERADIRVGSTDARKGGTTYRSYILMTHPKYNKTTFDFDVGIIQMMRPIELDGQNSTTVNIPSSNCSVTPGTNLTVSGWGTTQENGRTSTTLMEVSVDAVASDECIKTYDTLTPRMLCADVPGGGKDSCQGDSGGPLVRTGTKNQVGVVSFGKGCARPGIPGVYANLCNVDIQNWLKRSNCAK